MDTIAYYIGADNISSTLIELINSIGFKSIDNFTSLADVEIQSVTYPVCFFLFDQVLDMKMLKKTIDLIRACKRHKIRFSPLIYLCSNPSPNIIRQALALGFDDVIIKPITKSNIKTRFNLQIDKDIIYYETSNYFGPDRRRLDEQQVKIKTEKRKGAQYYQYKLSRNLVDGIKILEKKFLVS